MARARKKVVRVENSKQLIIMSNNNISYLPDELPPIPFPFPRHTPPVVVPQVGGIWQEQEEKLAKIFSTPSILKEFRTYAEMGCFTENLDFLLDLEQFKNTVSRLATYDLLLRFSVFS